MRQRRKLRRLAPTTLLALLPGLVALDAGAVEERRGSAAGTPVAPTTKIATLDATPTTPVVPDEVVVLFEDGVGRGTWPGIVAPLAARVTDRVPGSKLALVELAPGSDPSEAARALERTPEVAIAEPNRIARALATIPTDPDFSKQWGLHNTGQAHPITDPPPATIAGLADADGDLPEAWDTTTGDAGVVIAIFDTGVDLDHPDLEPNLWTNGGEIASNATDDDANGYVDDTNGYDFLDGDNDPDDTDDHGSHVAGIAAAAANNAVGGSGVCPDCSIMPLRGGDADGFPLFAELEAIDYAIDNGADIINMSIGGPVWSKLERRAIEDAGVAGVLVVAAAGNEARDNDQLDWSVNGLPDGPSYPGSYDLPNLISVAASNDLDEFGYFTGCADAGGGFECFFTNWGHTSVDLVAPGVDIYSTVRSGAFDTFNGTSMASPFVAGVAGLVLAAHPAYTPEQLRAAILNSVDDPAGLANAFVLTDGRVNADAALDASTAAPPGSGDDVMSGANRIRTRTSGRLDMPTDENDIFKKRLRKGRRYEVSLDVPRRRDFDLFVWKSGAMDTWPTDYRCSRLSCLLVAASSEGRSVDESVTFRARKTGIHYFHVTAFRGDGRYTLTIGRA